MECASWLFPKNIKPKHVSRQKAYGQNFLHHKPTIEKIINATGDFLEKNQSAILEIGPGTGALTSEIITLCEQHSLPFLIIEKDLRLEKGIQKLILNKKNTELIITDATTDTFVQKCLTFSTQTKLPLLIVSNLPYSVSTTILARLCELIQLKVEIQGCIVMVQKEVAMRICAEAGDSENRGSFSLLMQSYFSPTKLFDVAPGAFVPSPKVTSTVLALTPLPNSKVSQFKEPEKFEKFCKALFSKRRKMIRNTLSTLMNAQELQSTLKNCTLDGTERIETLELETVIELFKHLTQ